MASLQRPNTKRRELTVARLPELDSCLDRNESLGSRSGLVPVVLVFRAHPLEIDRERRVPIGNVLGFSEAGIIGDQIAIDGLIIERHYRIEHEPGALSSQSTFIFPQII